MAALRPHGLPASAAGSFAGKISATKFIGSNFPAQLGPHVLPKTLFASRDNVDLTLTGVSGAGQGGNPIADVGTGVIQLGPHGLVVKQRLFDPKGAFDVDLTLTGAGGFGQGEELEGVNVNITLDSGVGFGLAGSIPFPEPEGNSGGYGFENEYDAYRQRTRRRRKIRKIVRRHIRNIDDPVDREIAQRLHAQIEREQQELELQRFRDMLMNANKDFLIAKMTHLGLLEEYEAFMEDMAFSATQRLERLMDLSYTHEEEMLLLLLAMK